MADIFSAIGNGLSKVGKSAAREASRAADEFVTHIEEDFDSIATAIDEGGFVGGAIQAADVFSPGHRLAQDLDALNVIPEDAVLKELISGSVNLATASPLSLLAAKDLVDAIGASKSSARVAPSAAHAAPPPHDARSHADGGAHGYAQSSPSGCGHSSARVDETQRASLKELGEVIAALREMRAARAAYVKENPNAPVPTDGHYTIDEILNHPSMSTGEVCCRVVAVILHEHPEAVSEIGRASSHTPPAEAAAPAAESNTQAGQAVFGIFGQIASFVGPLLGNPLVGTALSALLLATPLAPIAPFLPVILPLAGGALTMAGGAASQLANGQDPTLGAGQTPGGGASPDMLGGLLQAIPAMLGAVPGAAPAPVPAT